MPGMIDMGRKFEGLEESPDLKIGKTSECFQEAGKSELARQELTICWMTSGITSKAALRVRTQIQSRPPEEVLRMLNSVRLITSWLTGVTANVRDDTRGKRHSS